MCQPADVSQVPLPMAPCGVVTASNLNLQQRALSPPALFCFAILIQPATLPLQPCRSLVQFASCKGLNALLSLRYAFLRRRRH